MGTRTERVVLELQDDFSSGMARAAASAALLNVELNRLDNNRISINTTSINQQLNQTSQSANRADGSINQLTGRLSLLADAALVLGPGLVPVGAVGAQALAGLAAAGTAAAIAGGSAVVAFQGLGDAVKAVDAYQLDPTVQNLEKAHEAMDKLGPAAQDFVMQFQRFQPILTEMRDSAAAGLFPGLTASLDDFERVAPQISGLLEAGGRAAGSFAENVASSLASDRWAPFIEFLTAEVPTAVAQLSEIMGNLAHGASEMFMAFDPGNDRFLSWVNDVAAGFDSWASSSSGQDSIRTFLEYARQNGPALGDLFSSLVGTLAAVVRAAAPLGGPVLSSLTAVSEVIQAIANSDLGTPILAAITAFRLYSRAADLAAAASTRFAATATAGGAAGAAPAAGAARFMPLLGSAAMIGGVAALALATSKAASANNDMVDSLRVVQDAVDSADFSTMTSSLADATDEVAAFKAKVEDGKGFGALLDPGALLANTKNGIEGIFGKSDVEEGEQALAALEEQIKRSQESAAGLGRALGMTIGPLDGSARSAHELQAALEAAKPSMDALGISQDDLTSAQSQQQIIETGNVYGQLTAAVGGTLTPFNDMTAAIQDKIQYMDSATGRTDNYVASLAALAQGEGTAADRATSLSQALDAMIDPANDLEAAITNYRVALSAVRDLHADAGFTQATTEGQKNLAVTRDFVEATKQRLVAMVNAGKGEKDLSREVGDSRREFIQSGVAAGFSAAQMRKRANAIGLTPKLVTTTFKALGINQFKSDVNTIKGIAKGIPKRVLTDIATNGIPKTKEEIDALLNKYKLTEKQRTAVLALIDKASGKIPAAIAALMSYDGKTATSFIITKHVDEYSASRRVARSTAEGAMDHGADGATVPKTGLPYADRHLYMLADGEEVISNRYGQADRFRADRSAGRIPGYADGGTLGGARGAGGNRVDFGDVHTFALTVGDTARGLKGMHKALEATTKELQAEKEQRKALVGTIRTNFSTDPFAQPSSVWAQGGSPISTLMSDITDLKQFQSTINNLRKRGLNGSALAEADTLSEAQTLAGMSRPDLARYEALFNQRARLATTVGGTYADAAGAKSSDIHRLEVQLRGIRRDIKAQEAENRRHAAALAAHKKAADAAAARRAAHRKKNP